MDRRTLLTSAAALSLMGCGASPLELAATDRSLRRVRPGDPGWPSDAQWEALNRTVGGVLEKPISPYGACGVAGGAKDCAGLIPELTNPFWLGDQAGATQAYGWLDAWKTAPSAWTVRARNASDVAAAVNFAREHHSRPVLVVQQQGSRLVGRTDERDYLLVALTPTRFRFRENSVYARGGTLTFRIDARGRVVGLTVDDGPDLARMQ